jgi:hypothetical protein
VTSKFLADITTHKIDPSAKLQLRSAMFRAIAVADNITYYCERLDIGSPDIKQGLVFSTSQNPRQLR